MARSRRQRLAVGSRTLDGVELTPQEYFVLSRVEGESTIADLLSGSGLGVAQTEAILERLLDVGALVLVDDVVAAPSPRPSSLPHKLRDSARDRRRELLRAQLAGRRAPVSATVSEPPRDEGITEPPSDRLPPPEDPSMSRFEVPLVPLGDPRIDKNLDIDLDDQRWILALADGQDRWTPFEFLGLAATHDMKVIKRGYHETSRRLHPDSYFSRNVGLYGDILGELFKRAKFYYSELRKEDVRNPYVDLLIETRARRAREAEEKLARSRASEDMRRAQEAAEAAVRRQQRAAERARRQRDRLRTRLDGEGRSHAAEAAQAEADGQLARAANLYRLALRTSPDNVEYRQKWERCRDRARRERAAEAYAAARRYVEFGQANEALPLLVEAAKSDPKLEYLADAADAVRHTDPSAGRDFAMAALDALVTESQESKTKRRAAEIVAIRVKVGRAFLAAGQKESAREQAMLAQQQRPDDPEVAALLKSLKVK